MMRTVLPSLALGAALFVAPGGAMVAAGTTLLGPLPYLSAADTPFDLNDPGFFLETFEDDLLNVPGVSASVGPRAVIGPGGNTDSVDADDGVIDGSGTLGHSIFTGAGFTGITFTFDPLVLGGLPTHVGIVWTDGAGTTLFQAFGPGGEPIGSIGPVAIATGGTSGQTDEDRFFGVINDAGVHSIKVSNTSGGIELDHLQYGTPGACPPASADINGDGSVDGADLGLLLGAWGACPAGGCCDADVSDDGSVDGADLGLVLAAWNS